MTICTLQSLTQTLISKDVTLTMHVRLKTTVRVPTYVTLSVILLFILLNENRTVNVLKVH